MKRIVLCFDGTWNKPADEGLPPAEQVETNVVRFWRSVAAAGPDGVAQQTWYDQGVGTHWYDEVAGGVFGAGLSRNIMAGYAALAMAYDDGDEVYLLGFSRGAYTARSLAGMIRNCGLMRADAPSWLVPVAYGIYLTRDDGPDSLAARTFRAHYCRPIPIRFLGVWDTVGALGIPVEVLDHVPAAERSLLEVYRFHDTELSGIVENACQAIAIDEHRRDFDICLWDPTEKPGQVIEQRWFAGAHCDVGGGYPSRLLSDLTLRWMQDRAAALGLALEPVAVTAENFRGPLTDSYAAFLDGRYRDLSPPHLRSLLGTHFGNEVIDASVEERRRAADLNYQPTNDGLPALAAAAP